MTASLPAGDRLPIGGGHGVYDAIGVGMLGGVPDPDVDALLRSSQPLRKR